MIPAYYHKIQAILPSRDPAAVRKGAPARRLVNESARIIASRGKGRERKRAQVCSCTRHCD